MSDNRNSKKGGMSRKTKTSITYAVFILAILVVILCIMSGALHFTPNTGKNVQTTPTPEVTAPPSTPTPSPSDTPEPTDTPAPETYSVTVFAGHGGTATPEGTTTVESGSTITIVFTPDDGYYVETVTVNGELVDPADSYTITDISNDVSIDVSFDTTPPNEQPSESTAFPG
jgi:hypothetical protein